MKNTAYSSFLTSALVVLVNLMPLPAMASEDKLYDYLIRFGTALDAFQLRRYPEAEAMASKLYDDACREGLDKPSASKVFHSSSGLDKVTPLLRVPVKYGTVYQRLFIEIRKLRGSTQSAAGKYALAGKELQSIVDQYPDFVDCRTALSIHYRRLKDYDKALQELDKAAQKNPRLISIFYSRVLIYREMGNREQEQKAVVEYNRLRVAQENEVGDFIRGTSAGADIKADEKKAEHMIAAHPTQSSPIAVYADIISGDRLEDARKYASIAIAVGSQQKFGYISRSDINLDLNLFREAEADASKAIEIDPKNLDTRITRALAYINSNRLNEALSDLNFAITHVPSWATPYSYRAAVYIEQGEYKEALEDARKAVRIDTEDPLGFNILGLCYCRLKMYPR
ncbi:MAG: tetratricopeptide repeat protein [Candidatus Melainabacteria bacterium]|nr:tetratricopeptide repeat protein [Candidatus Melainabacteria bacterium]